MGLNSAEQTLCDYVEQNPEEKRFWRDRVAVLVRTEAEAHVAAAQLARELWSYYEERSRVAEPFRSQVRREGLRPVSLRTLAEYLLRQWGPVRPAARTVSQADFL